MSGGHEFEHPLFPFLLERCRKERQIERVILFGSRARGDAKENSDFDIAVIAPELSAEDWARFCLDLREAAPTLCELDLLRPDETLKQELRDHIFDEGIVIYERL